MITNDEDSLNKDDKDSVFIVFSKCFKNSSNYNEDDQTLNAFIIEKETPGVTLKKQLSNFNGLNLYEIEFKDVKLTSENNLLGIDGSGHQIANSLSNLLFKFFRKMLNNKLL